MNSRERVLASLNHLEPDHIPIDFSGHRSSGINAMAYARLRKYLKLPEQPIRVYDMIQQLAIVDADILELFGVDTIELGRAFATGDEMWKDWYLPDGTPCQVPVWVNNERIHNEWVIKSNSGELIARMPDGALYFEQTCFPFAEKDDLNDLSSALQSVMWSSSTCAAPPGPLQDTAEGLDRSVKEARIFREKTDKAIIGLFGGSIFELGQHLYRNDNYFLLLAGEPDRAHVFLDRLIEQHLADLERYLTLFGDFIDIIVFGDDLGMQSGPQISPKMYREFFKPRHKLMWDRVKSMSKAKILLHCCGSIKEFLPDLIEAGVDAVNPVQISCANMDVADLKAEFGKDITFWGGGCDTGQMLPAGTPEMIRDHVKKQIEILRPGGGFVFQQVHNILNDVPPENIVAMFNAIR